MTFGDDLDSALVELRAMAEERMTDTCIITRPGTGKGPFNAETGQYDPPDRIAVYGPDVEPHRGKCEIQVQSVTAGASASDAGDRAGIVQASELKLPVSGTENVAVKDVAEILAATHDQALVGRKFTVTARHDKSRATARRLPVKEVTG